MLYCGAGYCGAACQRREALGRRLANSSKRLRPREEQQQAIGPPPLTASRVGRK
jgi:hypothetical protein